MRRDAYDVWLDNLLLPITPSSMTIKTNNKNETVTLVNGGEINLVKTPGLTEISFDFLVPAVIYGYSKTQEFPIDIIKQMARFKLSKRPFYFRVIRQVPIGLQSLDSSGNYNMYTRAEITNDLMGLDMLETSKDVKTAEAWKEFTEAPTTRGGPARTFHSLVTPANQATSHYMSPKTGNSTGAIGKLSPLSTSVRDAISAAGRSAKDALERRQQQRNDTRYSLFDQRMLVTVEDYDIKEDAEQYGFDFLVSVTLKQYREYGTKIVFFSTDHKTATVTETRPYEPVKTRFNYTVVKGDCLEKISKVYYGNTKYWENIRSENTDVIAADTLSSAELTPGMTLRIPPYDPTDNNPYN